MGTEIREKLMERIVSFLLSRDDSYHRRGYCVVAQALRESGVDVILGELQMPRAIVETVIQEDVDIITNV